MTCGIGHRIATTSERPFAPDRDGGTPRPHDDEDHDPVEILLGNDPEADHWNTLGRSETRYEIPQTRAKIRWFSVLRLDGFHVVLSLIGLMLALGFLALALTLAGSRVTIPTLALSAVCLVWAVIRWRRWLARAPYFYRLMTSLGEDAENLLDLYIWTYLKRIALRLGLRKKRPGPRKDRARVKIR